MRRIWGQVVKGSRGRWLLLGTAVLQALSPLVSSFDGSGDDPPVVPPAPFFAVWGVVVTGCLASALWGLPLRRATAAPFRDVQVPLSVAQVGFALWLAAASSSVPVLTVPVFAVMLAALAVALRAVVAARADRTTRLLLGTTVGVYAGWTTAAVFVNAASLLPGTGVDATSVALQCLAVAGAGLAAAVGARATGGQLPYVLTAAYALVGVALSAARADVPALLAVAVAALAVVAATAGLTRRTALRAS